VQAILFSDNQTSNLLSIYVKCGQVKHTREKGKWEEKRNRNKQMRGEREEVLVKKANGVGRYGR
jgi:hypothetical protein